MKKIIVVLLSICTSVGLFCFAASAEEKEVNWNLMDVEFAGISDYDPAGLVNVGLPTNSFAPQAGKDIVSLKKDGDLTYINIPALASGNTLLEGTFYSNLEAKDVADPAAADINLVIEMRFRSPDKATGMNFKIGSSNYRTIISCRVDNEGNLILVPFKTVIAEGVNDGEWHTLRITAEYSADKDSIRVDCDDKTFTDKFSGSLLRKEAPIMTFLLMKEPCGGSYDIDYIRIGDDGTSDHVQTEEQTEEPDETTTAGDNTTAADEPHDDTSASTTAKDDTAAGSEAVTTESGAEEGGKSQNPWLYVVIAAVVVAVIVVVIVVVKKKKA